MPKTLRLTLEQQQQIIRHALDAYPEEACGLMTGSGATTEQIIPAKNIATDPYHRYRIDDTLLARHVESMIGIYHSHPDDDPILSRVDVAEAWYPDTVYVVVGLKHETPALAAWQVRRGRVERVTLHTDDHPPVTEATTDAQKTAIILGAMLSFILFIIIAVSLLPTAPPIP